MHVCHNYQFLGAIFTGIAIKKVEGATKIVTEFNSRGAGLIYFGTNEILATQKQHVSDYAFNVIQKLHYL